MNERAWLYAHCAPENLIKKNRNDFYPFLNMKWTNARFLRTQSACAIIIHANRFSWASICFWITWRLLQTSRNVNICFLSYNTDQVSKMYLLFQKKCQNSSRLLLSHIKSTRRFGVKVVVPLFVMEGTKNILFGSSTTDFFFVFWVRMAIKKSKWWSCSRNRLARIMRARRNCACVHIIFEKW